MTRAEMKKAAITRVRKIEFGEAVTNICAGLNNPLRHSYFVRHNNNMRTAMCTDKKGAFWDIGIDVVYPGHLDADTCEALFAPVWQALYGDNK